ncbi:MAG: ABC transporter ATP-binding protein [Lewinellaceae bacterium]|nr:ABC transporter ATP-binding protein [Lewinellaceae bacterium]
MIQVQHIKKSFGKLCVLHDLSLNLELGQSVAIVGPNGSGKTTFIKTILGMVMPDSGAIVFNGKTLDNSDASYRHLIGYMPQIGRYPDNMQVGQLFDMMLDLRHENGQNLDEELIEAYQLPAIYQKSMRTLSGGTRQKVSAALAFLFNPQVLILDEPTAGLDPLSCEILKQKILRTQQQNRLFILSSHIMSDLEELSTHILYLMEGQVVFNKTLEALRVETGHKKLGKAIASIMATNGYQA